MNRLLALGVAALLTAPLIARTPRQHQGMPHDPDKMVQGGGKLPPEWKARLDLASAKPDAVKFENAGGGFHITTGPAGVYYPPQAHSGAYQVEATFTQLQASAHPEAYGLFIGGADLQGANQKYTYFLIRQDGKFLIKRRAGALTKTVTDWTDSPAITKADPSGKMTNTLSIDVAKEKVSFLVNGTEVTSQPPAQVDAAGLAGLRVNHNLDLQVEGLTMNAAPKTSKL